MIVNNQNLSDSKKRGLLMDYYQVLFCFNSIKQLNTRYKINQLVNNFLLGCDKLMPELYLRKPGFTCIACGPFI